MTYSSEQYLLRAASWTGYGADFTTALPDQDITLSDGVYTITYRFLSNLSDAISAGYTSTSSFSPGFDHYEYDNFDVTNSIQQTAARTVMHEQGGYDYDYSVFFSDVTHAIFSSASASSANITFGQIDDSLGFYGEDNTHGGITYDYTTTPSEPGQSSDDAVYGNIWLNENASGGWGSADAGSSQFYNVLHEMGHALGLKHPEDDTQGAGAGGTLESNQQYTMMSTIPSGWSISGSTLTPGTNALYDGSGHPLWAYGLQLNDIAAIQDIYQSRNHDVRSEDNTTYDFGHGLGRDADLSAAFMYSVWDGGGTHDTLDAHEFDGPVKIDLREGAFSSIGTDGNGNNGLDYTIDGGGDFSFSKEIQNVSIAYHTVIEDAVGTDGNDILIGNAWGNTLNGGDGNDFLYGSGVDYDSDEGFTTPDSSDSNDPNATKPASTLDNDILIGGAGHDTLWGGSGSDTADYHSAAAGITVDLSAGSNQTSDDGDGSYDSLHSIENVRGSAYADSITGDSHDNTFYGGGGHDTLDGGSGSDTADYSYAAAGVTVDLSAGSNQTSDDGDGSYDSLTSIENVRGSAHNDTITGDSHYNIFYGSGGSDTITGSANFSDSVDYSGVTAAVDVTFTDTGATVDKGAGAEDTLVNILNVTGTQYADTFSGVALQYSSVHLGDTSYYGYSNISGGTGGDHYDFDLSTMDNDVNWSTAVEITDTGATGTDHLSINAGVDDADIKADFYNNGDGTFFMDVFTNGAYDHDVDTFGEFQVNIVTPLDPLTGAGVETFTFGDDHTYQMIDVLHWIAANHNGFGYTHGYDSSELANFIATTGDDTLTGGDGNDSLLGSAGNDTMDGGGGINTVVYSYAAASVTVDLSSDTANDDGDGGSDTLSNFQNVIGSAFNDTLTGDSGANTLTGGAGNDTMAGKGGADAIDGGSGTDTADYGAAAGGVTVDLSAGSASNDGDSASDTLTSIENVTGSAHNDTITGDGNDNVLTGGAGNDSLTGGGGNDTIAGGAGTDTIDGGTGTDTADYSAAAAGVTVDLSAGSASNDGDSASDTLTSIENVTGSTHNDTITGDGNDNVLTGGAGNDSLTGGGGNDTIAGGAGTDAIDGGSGTDTVDYTAAAAAVTVSLASGTASNDGDGGADTLTSIENVTGSTHNDTITGDGNDNVLTGGAGNDTLDGGAGINTVVYSYAAAGVTVNLAAGTVSDDGVGGSDTLSNFQNVIGSAFDDTVIGDSSANTLTGGAGNDSLYGSDGNDTLYVDGGSYDSLYGGDGIDTVNYANASGGLELNLLLGITYHNDGSYDYLDTIENATGSGYNDVIRDDLGDNALAGGAGNDSYFVSGGDDTITESGGIDTVHLWTGATLGDLTFSNTGTADLTISDSGVGSVTLVDQRDATPDHHVEYMSLDDGFIMSLADYSNWHSVSGTYNAGDSGETVIGSSGDDTITGGAGNDVIIGMDGTDTLNGGDGSDLIHGGSGDDTLSGGAGNDTIWSGSGGNDVIDGGAGNDTVSYGADPGDGYGDGVYVDLGTGIVEKNGWSSSDTLTSIENATGSAYNDELHASGDGSILKGGDGDDTLFDGNGNDFLDGGEGFNIFYFTHGSDIIQNTTRQFEPNAYGGNHLYINANFEDLTFSVVNSTDLKIAINGTSDNVTLIDHMIDPDLDLAAQVQTLTLNGGFTFNLADYSNWHYVSGTYSTSDDYATVIGASGADTVSVSGINASILGMGGDDILTAGGGWTTGIHGGDGNDTITGGDGYSTLWGDAGNDTITGGTSNDYIYGGDGADVIHGGGGNDTIIGDDGNDQLYGGSSFDYIAGGAGDDFISGGGGNDSFAGGTGADTFYFDHTTALSSVVTITDFSTSDGDELDIHDILTGYTPGTSVITDFVHITASGSNAIVSVDANGTTGGASFTQIATLTGGSALAGHEDDLLTNGNLIAHV